MEEQDKFASPRQSVSEAQNDRLVPTGKATAALACGVASIASCVLVPMIGPPAGIIFGIVAIVLGTSFTKMHGSNSRVKVGRTCGILGLVISLLLLALALTGHAIAAVLDVDADVERRGALVEVFSDDATA